MGEVELKEALQREAELQVRKAWHEAEGRVDQRRLELTEERERLGELAHGHRTKEVEALRRAALFEARNRIRIEGLRVSQSLAERLRRLAEEEVKSMAVAGGEALFRRLVRELPDLEWSVVVITPEARGWVDTYFPAAVVREDPALLGGFVAEAGDGRIKIDNSLAGRLDRFWPQLLANVLAELETEEKHAAARADTES